MKTTCATCGADYFETWEDGGYCFGCGYHERTHVIVCSNKEARRQPLRIRLRCLERLDYRRLGRGWGVTPEQADRYGLAIAEAGEQRWLYLPVYDDDGKEVHCQLRKWNAKCPRKYMTKTQPPPGLIWKSWQGACPGPVVAVVEGVLDGIRVGEVVPAIALFGSAANEEKVREILKAVAQDTTFLIMLDGDAPDKALKVAGQLGLGRSKVIRIEPGKDPTDYTSAGLRQLIESVVTGET